MNLISLIKYIFICSPLLPVYAFAEDGTLHIGSPSQAFQKNLNSQIDLRLQFNFRSPYSLSKTTPAFTDNRVKHPSQVTINSQCLYQNSSNGVSNAFSQVSNQIRCDQNRSISFEISNKIKCLAIHFIPGTNSGGCPATNGRSKCVAFKPVNSSIGTPAIFYMHATIGDRFNPNTETCENR